MKINQYSSFVRTDNPPHPDDLHDDIIYLDIDLECFLFACPCGIPYCYVKIRHKTPENKAESPAWSLEEHEDGTISLSPSISRSGGCTAHYYIKRNKVQWC